jgi:hypothetical protein
MRTSQLVEVFVCERVTDEEHVAREQHCLDQPEQRASLSGGIQIPGAGDDHRCRLICRTVQLQQPSL